MDKTSIQVVLRLLGGSQRMYRLWYVHYVVDTWTGDALLNDLYPSHLGKSYMSCLRFKANRVKMMSIRGWKAIG